jgi:hypothetical protein
MFVWVHQYFNNLYLIRFVQITPHILQGFLQVSCTQFCPAVDPSLNESWLIEKVDFDFVLLHLLLNCRPLQAPFAQFIFDKSAHEFTFLFRFFDLLFKFINQTVVSLLRLIWVAPLALDLYVLYHLVRYLLFRQFFPFLIFSSLNHRLALYRLIEIFSFLSWAYQFYL